MNAARFSMLAAAALAIGGCDRLEQALPLKRTPGTVTVKLPPPKAATPGFAFNDGKKDAAAPLR